MLLCWFLALWLEELGLLLLPLQVSELVRQWPELAEVMVVDLVEVGVVELVWAMVSGELEVLVVLGLVLRRQLVVVLFLLAMALLVVLVVLVLELWLILVVVVVLVWPRPAVVMVGMLWPKLCVLLLIVVLVVVVVGVWVVVVVGVWVVVLVVVLLFLEVIRQWPELGSWKVLGVALVEVTLLVDMLEVTQVGPTHQPPWRMRKSTCCRFPVVLGGLGISPAIP